MENTGIDTAAENSREAYTLIYKKTMLQVHRVDILKIHQRQTKLGIRYKRYPHSACKGVYE